MDDVVVRGRLRCYSVEETGVDQLLEKEFDVSELRVLDAEGFEHAEVAIFDSHKDGAKMFQVRTHQV